MAISTYAELKTAVANWLERDDLTDRLGEFVTLAEAKINRRIPASEEDTTLTGTSGSRRIDVSALTVAAPVALWDTTDGDEAFVTYRADGSFSYDDTPGAPSFWTMDGSDAIDFDRPLDQARSFRFRYRGRLALSDAAPTNWLLTHHPDAYLCAVLVEAADYIKDRAEMQLQSLRLSHAIAYVKMELAERNRSALVVDTMLAAGRGYDRNFPVP